MEKIIRPILMIVCCLFYFNLAVAADSDRRAMWQIQTKQANPLGREITKIEDDSPMAKAGVEVGDILQSVNGELVSDSNQWWDLIYALRADTSYQVVIKRGVETLSKQVAFPPVVKESYPNLVTEYDWVVSDYGIKQRTIVTYPKNAGQKIAAIFVVGGLSCSSIEYTPGRKSNFIRSLRYFLENSNMLMMRVEKPGVGDSQGRCSKTDFDTELNGYEAALKSLLQDRRVDPKRVIVYGSSMGSALAPYLANKYQLNGVISDGTFYRSWFEHMLEIERRILSMKGDDETTINQKMITAYIPMYYGMLVEKKSYARLVQEKPLLAEYNYHGPQHMYGRPMAFYHQMQDFNFAGEWSKLTVPARLRWGTNDWIMSEYDIDMIEDVLQRAGNDNVQVYKYPGLDHWDTVHQSALNSFQGKPGRWEKKIGQQLVDWAKELNKK